MLASARLWPRHHARPFAFGSVLYGLADRVDVVDASQRRDLQPLAVPFGLPQIGAFFRRPILHLDRFSICLVVVGDRPGEKLRSRESHILTELTEIMRDRVQEDLERLAAGPQGSTTTATLEEEKQKVGRSSIPAVLLDHELRILAVNGSAAHLLDRDRAALIGQSITQFTFPGVDTIALFMRRALSSGVSAPAFEILPATARDGRMLEVSLSPFRPVESRSAYLLASARPIAERSGDVHDAERVHPPRRGTADPALAFLQDTLVPRRTIRSRNGVSYLSLRRWRVPIRRYQIAALKALKKHSGRELPETVAGEMALEIIALMGTSAFRVIVPVPCGHSQGGPCLSVEIARELGSVLRIPVVHALFSAGLSGSSHPKENVRRPPMGLLNPVSDPAILVDDVASSGAHLEQAVRLLKPHCGAVLPIVWIGGNAA